MKVSSLPCESRIACESSYQLVTFLPLIEVILSPGWKPAAAAAEFGETCVTSESRALTPTPKKIEKMSKKPITKCLLQHSNRMKNQCWSTSTWDLSVCKRSMGKDYITLDVSLVASGMIPISSAIIENYAPTQHLKQHNQWSNWFLINFWKIWKWMNGRNCFKSLRH